MSTHDEHSIKAAVRDRYAGHATARSACCAGSCCAPVDGAHDAEAITEALGYRLEDLSAIPGDANLGLGCGNPLGLASIGPGETVLDLGSGGGLDCFIAARKVGPEGRVIGVDMTPEMIALAQANAVRAGFGNVDFRLGEIERLPVADETADLVVSNCVINLVPDKVRAFAEAYRVTVSGGRISVSDIVTSEPLPQIARDSVAGYVACLGGASTLEEYLSAIRAAGFVNVEVVSDTRYDLDEDEAAAMLGTAQGQAPTIEPGEATRVAQLFHSVTVQATKP